MNTLIFSCLLVAIYLAAKLARLGRRERHLPPGPPTLPILGNLLDIPKGFAYLKIADLALKYGDVYSLKLGSGTIIVLTSALAVKEFIDQRSASTADRPDNHFVQLVTDGLNLALARYGDNWRRMRKGANSILTPHAAARHVSVAHAEASQLLYDLLKTPQTSYTHMQRYSNSFTTSIVWGKRAPRSETYHNRTFQEAQERWDRLLAPGAHPPVDILPILKYLPAFLAPWKKECREIRRLQHELAFGAYDECEARVKQGEDIGCHLEDIIRKRDELKLSKEQAAYLGYVLIEGGSATTASVLQSIMLALVSHPEAQKKAQAEIDRVIGSERTPTIDDLKRLPYVQAFIQEVHRTRPVGPVAIPHRTSITQQYRGYAIPKDSAIFVNAWGIYHDPKAFEAPDIFNPERFLHSTHGTKDGFDDSDFRSNFHFGSGRRICPGQIVAHNSVGMNTMNFVWAFDFAPLEEGGYPYALENYIPGLTCTPKPFQCTIVPRSEAKAKMIEKQFFDAVPVFETFEDALSAEEKDYLRKTRTKL